MIKFLFAVFIILTLSKFKSNAQQTYSGNSVFDCESFNETEPSSSFLYTCNMKVPSCQAFLIFRTVPPYISVSTICNLTSCDPLKFARINNVSTSGVFSPGQEVIVPVKCSCSGQYYQANTSYISRPVDNTHFTIANNTYQGLTTCKALMRENVYGKLDLQPGYKLRVPLRCSCPTEELVWSGTKFMMTYLITWGDTVPNISRRFNVSTRSVALANGFSEKDPELYPFTTLLVPLVSEPFNSQMRSYPFKRKISYRGLVIGGLIFISLVGLVVVCVFWRKKRQKIEPVLSTGEIESANKSLFKKEEGDESHDFHKSLSSIAQSLKVYTIKELRDATEDFSAGFLIKGSVYRERINGNLAAIKKMKRDVSKEISLLNNINHYNLIRLSGVCHNEGNWYLVYEYAPKGKLSNWIHQTSERKTLNWNQRLQITLDVATGLNYLHNYTSPPYVHKDLNSSNVLLDKDLRAKIANFGLARSAEGQEGQFALTRYVVGTVGYMAPEYLERGLVSPKLDVYAFGILMLEVVTGKEIYLLREEVNVLLLEVNEEVVSKFMDPLLEGYYPPKLAILIFKLVGNCLVKDPSRRPNMDDIFQSLSRIMASTLSGEWQNSISEIFTLPR